METIAEIYRKYRIMPNLQLHQLRVAAVGKIIAESLTVKVNTQSIIEACLLHDMGNILKFDLARFPQFTQEHGLSYWENVKKDMCAKYGHEEHAATQAIAAEVCSEPFTHGCLQAVGFSQAVKNASGTCLEHKICCYADQRVGPMGVLPLEERIAEGRKRKAKPNDDIEAHERAINALREIERQVFSECQITPEAITDERVEKELKNLGGFRIGSSKV